MTRPRFHVREGFTLIELLVCIAIMAVLMSILLPALSLAREQGKRSVCMSNMRQIGTAQADYLADNTNLPWTYVYQLNTAGGYSPYPGGNGGYSSYTWGGMKATKPDAGYERVDWSVVPAEARPFNKFLDAAAVNKSIVKSVICPGDRSSVSPVVGQDQPLLEIEENKKSWEAFGNSYSINWHYLEDPGLNIYFTFQNLMGYGQDIVAHGVGGDSSEFITFFENQADQLFDLATPDGKGRQGSGWHRRFSYHTMLFLDSHVEHKYFDTRYPVQPGWRIWRRPTMSALSGMQH